MFNPCCYFALLEATGYFHLYSLVEGGGMLNMLSNNIKIIRKEKGLSQEEVAIKLNIVRQTLSKWEKGLSVPDAQLLIKLAEILGVPASVLLGDEIESLSEQNIIAEHLEEINAQLSQRNKNHKSVWKGIIFFLIAIFLTLCGLMILNIAR